MHIERTPLANREGDQPAEPVSLDAAKLHLRVDGNDEDSLIGNLIAAARQHIEDRTGLALVPTEVTAYLDAMPAQSRGCGASVLGLPVAPFAELLSFSYLDAFGAEQTLAAGDIRAGHMACRSYLAVKSGQWPQALRTPGAITVGYIAGFGIGEDYDYQATAELPAPLAQAMLLLIGHWYKNRESVVTGAIAVNLPQAVDALIGPYMLPVV